MAQESAMFVLGLTGSIGMGKSTVSGFFREEGVPVNDADAVVHQLYSTGGAAVGPVGAEFPSAVKDGAIDRAALSACVVGNPAALARLEGLVHPLVAAEKTRFLQEAAAAGHTLAVLDIPLLYETRAEGSVDAVLVVSAAREVQVARVLARPGMTRDKLSAIMGRQVPDEEKRRRADFVIATDVSLEETRAHVAALVKALRGRRGSGRAFVNCQS